jgi:hypothetical protein
MCGNLSLQRFGRAGGARLSMVALRLRVSGNRFWPELQVRITQLERERYPKPGLRLPQAKLSRKSNQVARRRIRWFESDMPSHAVGSLTAYLAMGAELERGRFRSSVQSARRSYLLASRSISSRAN